MKFSLTLIALSSVLIISCNGKKSSESSTQTSTNNPSSSATSNSNSEKASNKTLGNAKKTTKKDTENNKSISTYTYKCSGHLIDQDGKKVAKDSEQMKRVTFSANESPEVELLYSNGSHTVAFEKGYGRVKIVTYKGEDIVGKISTSIGTRSLELTVLTQDAASSIRCDLVNNGSKSIKLDLTENFDCRSTMTSTKEKSPSGFNIAQLSLTIDDDPRLNLQEVIDGEFEELQVSSLNGMSHLITNQLGNSGLVYGYAGVTKNSTEFEYLLNSDNGMSFISCKRK